MDIWKWVHDAEDGLRGSGQIRLARLIARLPGYVCDDDHARVDSVIPEALALAKASKNPWLEIFVRHWHLQSRVLHRLQAREALSEAVSLVEFAHRDGNKACPQSVCTTQDLAACYAAFDGPGYAEERLAVASESLARIDPDWPCFSCISTEYSNALLDAGRADEAFDFVTQQVAAVRAAGDRFRQQHNMSAALVDVLLKLERPEEALAIAQETGPHLSDNHQKLRLELVWVRALAAVGRHEEALEHVLPLETIRPTMGLYESWLMGVEALALAGAIPNDWRLDAQIADLQRRMVSNGVVRWAFDTALRRGTLAVRRRRPATARQCVTDATALLEQLRTADGAAEALAALSADIDANAAEHAFEVPDDVDAMLDMMSDDPETDLERVLAAREQWPDHEGLVIMHGSALQALGRLDDAADVVAQWRSERDAGADTFILLGQILTQDGRSDDLLRLVEHALTHAEDPEIVHQAHYFGAQVRRERGERPAARQHLEQILAAVPTAINTRLTLAGILFEMDALEDSMAHLDLLVEQGEGESGSWDWDRMVVGTLLGRWDAVRQSAALVGFQADGEGPFEEAWGPVRVRFRGTDGASSDMVALRTGPVTARVLEMDKPTAPSRYHDAVVFDATPINPPPEDPDARATFVPLFEVVGVLQSGGYRMFSVDGIYPGDEAWEALRQAVVPGAALQLVSGAHYELTSPAGAKQRGLYAYLAVAEKTELAAVHAALTKATATWPGPIIWPSLAAEAGLEEVVAVQRGVADRYGITLDS